MNESTTTKKTTTKVLEMDQEDIERLIRDWLGDSAETEWAFIFDFDVHAEIVARITRTITETVKEQS